MKRSYEDFSELTKTVFEDKSIDERRRFEYWTKLQEDIGARDEIRKELAKKYGRLSILFSWLLILSLMTIVVGQFFTPTWIFVVGGIAGFLTFVVMLVINNDKTDGYRRNELGNQYLSSVLWVIDRLKYDIHPQSKISLKLDLTDGQQDGSVVSSTTEEQPTRTVTTTVFEQKGCSMAAILHDGTQLKMMIERRIIESKRTTRKIKCKYKALTKVTATLIPNSQSLNIDKESFQDLSNRSKSKLSVKKNHYHAQTRVIFKYKNDESPLVDSGTVDQELILGLFLELLACTKPANEPS